MRLPKSVPNPDLSVGPNNKQRWNQPEHRRHGFHNAHLLFRRALMFRARTVLTLTKNGNHSDLGSIPEVAALTSHPAFSALVCARGDQILYETCAEDFSTTHPHSIQSISKMHIHLIVGKLAGQGLLDLGKPVSYYLPDIGSGYATAPVQNLLDMNVANDFSEDYEDPQAGCYTEEIALGWRLPIGDAPEPTLREFANGITGDNLTNQSGFADYKSANTDVLTLICAKISPVPLSVLIENIVDAAGYEGSFQISASAEGLPAFSGGGCMSAEDLARFGLLIARRGIGVDGKNVAARDFLDKSLTRSGVTLLPPRDWLRYSNHLMTDGRLVGHAGYGGQFLLVDMSTGISCAFLSVLLNESGYDSNYMTKVLNGLSAVLEACQ